MQLFESYPPRNQEQKHLKVSPSPTWKVYSSPNHCFFRGLNRCWFSGVVDLHSFHTGFPLGDTGIGCGHHNSFEEGRGVFFSEKLSQIRLSVPCSLEKDTYPQQFAAENWPGPKRTRI